MFDLGYTQSILVYTHDAHRLRWYTYVYTLASAGIPM